MLRYRGELLPYRVAVAARGILYVTSSVHMNMIENYAVFFFTHDQVQVHEPVRGWPCWIFTVLGRFAVAHVKSYPVCNRAHELCTFLG